jgi:LCP family protein required for cell wall assembly
MASDDGTRDDDSSPRWPGPSPGEQWAAPGRPGEWLAEPAEESGPAGHSGTRRRSNQPGAQQQLMARLAAGRKARQRRALAVACSLASAVVLLIAGGGWALTSYVNGAVGRVNAGTTGTPSSGPLNILVAGVDLRAGLSPAEQARLHVGHAISSNSDTMMIVHVPAHGGGVSVVSLPRDSWVDIPGHGMSKINAAFGIGGPKLMVQTVEQNTGLTINDYIEVNFPGFVKVVNALGGVNICLPFAVNDPYSGLHMSAGPHHVHGVTALEFVRDRHSFALSDLARIKDQQQLLSSMLREAISSGTLADPVKLSGFLSAVTGAIKVDQRLNVTSLADRLRGISPSQVTFMTVPLANTNYITPTGESAVLWDSQAAGRLFAELKADDLPVKKPPPRPAKKKQKQQKQPPGPKRSQVSVDVYNGTRITGLSANTGVQLTQLGFTVHGAGLSWTSSDVAQTVIEYPPGMITSAQAVHRVLPGASIRQVSGVARVSIVLGTSGHQVTGPPPSTPGQGSAGPDGQKTAAQDACRK